MPKVSAEHEHETLTECKYSFPAETLTDIRSVRAAYRDLRMYVDFYCSPNKVKRKLVYLAGTVPVHYDGNDYNIPVCIWLHENHPISRPRCYVCPSVSMVINPSCPWVDPSGHIALSCLSNWTNGVSTLPLLVTEMRRAFQKDTPLYATPPALNKTPPTPTHSVSDGSWSSSSSSSHKTRLSFLTPPQPSGEGAPASQWQEVREASVRRSYTEELLGIDFSSPGRPEPPSSSHLLPYTSSGSDCGLQTKDTVTQDNWQTHPERPERTQVSLPVPLPPDKAAMFRSLLAMEGRCFNTTDVMEAVQLNRDLHSALKYLSHTCPICQDQVSFSKITTMTHCSCAFCESCFKAYFSAAIKEKSIEQLVCPLCSWPDIRGQGALEESMDYFNLLDTQIRHYLDPQSHELFQRKLRDRTLQEMPNFRWCAHCCFGVLHEAEQLRMDCPSCKKSTCSQCRSAWAPEHQGLSCQQFREWQLQNNPEYQTARLENLLSKNKIECPDCQFVFYLSKGGCLHFTCTQCQHEFCGSCSRPFRLGSACGFSAECGTKGLHAHHPRDCLYHLRDWSVARLHQLLQYYRVPPTCLGSASSSSADSHLQGVCSVLELRDAGSRREEPCGRPALPEHRGYCQLHYKEHLVELIKRTQADPAVLFDPVEMVAELRRWHVAVPTRKPQEPEPLYTQRLRLTLTHNVPLTTYLPFSVKVKDDLCPLTSSSSTGSWLAARGLSQDPQAVLLLSD
ncbi:E3 ubiquitin-protein ligase RNF31 isoform 2-T2 [Polymixia lowei]